MDADPRPPEDESPDSWPAEPIARWWPAGALLAGVGILLGAAAIVSNILGTVSTQQAIALGLPAALLIAAGLILALSKNAAGRRLGYRVGHLLGTIVGRLRSLLSSPENH
jgi:hypothetical protein